MVKQTKDTILFSWENGDDFYAILRDDDSLVLEGGHPYYEETWWHIVLKPEETRTLVERITNVWDERRKDNGEHA